jgi:hypothetical protein
MSDVVAFDRAHAWMDLSEGNAVVTKATEADGSFYTAASGAVLKGGGRHMVQLTVRKGVDIAFGLIGAGWDVEGGADAYLVQGHSFYSTATGNRYPGPSDRAPRRRTTASACSSTSAPAASPCTRTTSGWA